MTSSIESKGPTANSVVVVIENAAVRVEFLQRCLFFVRIVCAIVFLQAQKALSLAFKFVSTSISFRRPLYVMLARRSHLEKDWKNSLPAPAIAKCNYKNDGLEGTEGPPVSCSAGSSQEVNEFSSVTTARGMPVASFLQRRCEIKRFSNAMVMMD
jgi:hypothetical protein